MFEVGEFVRLVNGWTKLRVIAIEESTGIVRATYNLDALLLSEQECSIQERYFDEFVHWDGGNCRSLKESGQWKKGNVTMTKLFQTNEATPRYGTLLTTNSKGQLVLELKGSGGEVKAFDKDDVTEVKPYTIAAKSLTDNRHTCHYTTEEGILSVGDVFLTKSFNLYVVTAVDTKSDNAKKDLALHGIFAMVEDV